MIGFMKGCSWNLSLYTCSLATRDLDIMQEKLTSIFPTFIEKVRYYARKINIDISNIHREGNGVENNNMHGRKRENVRIKYRSKNCINGRSIFKR